MNDINGKRKVSPAILQERNLLNSEKELDCVNVKNCGRTSTSQSKADIKDLGCCDQIINDQRTKCLPRVLLNRSPVSLHTHASSEDSNRGVACDLNSASVYSQGCVFTKFCGNQLSTYLTANQSHQNSVICKDSKSLNMDKDKRPDLASSFSTQQSSFTSTSEWYQTSSLHSLLSNQEKIYHDSSPNSHASINAPVSAECKINAPVACPTQQSSFTSTSDWYQTSPHSLLSNQEKIYHDSSPNSHMNIKVPNSTECKINAPVACRSESSDLNTLNSRVKATSPITPMIVSSRQSTSQLVSYSDSDDEPCTKKKQISQKTTSSSLKEGTPTSFKYHSEFSIDPPTYIKTPEERKTRRSRWGGDVSSRESTPKSVDSHSDCGTPSSLSKRKYEDSVSEHFRKKTKLIDGSPFGVSPDIRKTKSRRSLGSSSDLEDNPKSSSAKRNSVSIYVTPARRGLSGLRNTDKEHTRRKSSSDILRSSADQTPYSPLLKMPYDQQRGYSFLPRYNATYLQTLDPGVGFIDTHCHLDFLFKREDHYGSYKEYRENMENYPKSYEGCVAVFCDPKTFKNKAKWQHIINEDKVWAAFGCHPHNASEYDTEVDVALSLALKDASVVALGEIGLDYSVRNNCPRDVQHKVFKRQLKLAIDRNLPLVIHSRESHEDCLEIMKKEVPSNHRIHLHCFSDEWEVAKQWMEDFPSLYFGFTNLVTYPSATKVHHTVRNLPLDRLLLETDAPYFVPRALPRTLQLSHPGMAIHVAAQIAAIRSNETIEEILVAARKNTRNMYGI